MLYLRFGKAHLLYGPKRIDIRDKFAGTVRRCGEFERTLVRPRRGEYQDDTSTNMTHRALVTNVRTPTAGPKGGSFLLLQKLHSLHPCNLGQDSPSNVAEPVDYR